ncbi:transferrin [Trichonephila inaurata madagascariensis]|uniref:Transferrin n=1 Tax=Trichonephila inaurata madagascariensis TaxID=2747483 RepID=A0A8X6X3V3_9ARAC|nr:transferrin [Trichonephila inaurata madagascariensis]
MSDLPFGGYLRFECVQKISRREADVTNVDPNGLYLGGKYYDFEIVATELVDGEPFRYQGIALVQKGSNIRSASDLRNRTSCHTGYRRTVGWQIPVGRLLHKGLMRASCDEGEIAAVNNFFGGSCVPGNWSSDPEVDSKLKARYPKLCSRCRVPEACSANDEYAGYEGVMNCLSDGAADVAFTKIPALREYLQLHPEFEQKAELLCFNGGRKSLRDPNPCVWGVRPTNAFITKDDDDLQNKVMDTLKKTQSRYSDSQALIPDWYHKSFLSHPKVSGLRPIADDRKTYDHYLGDFLHSVRKPRRGCEHNRNGVATICVTSPEEKKKCEDYSKAAEAQDLFPDIRCIETISKAACMEHVKQDNSQLLVLDGGDVYKAGRYYGLQPIASELYNGSDATYYAVAVMRSVSDVLTLSQLRGLRSCHTGMGRTAGWVMPVGVLLSEGLLQETNCNHAEAMADFFFAGSCVPGANDSKTNPGRVRSDDLCRHCIGDDLGMHKCARDSRERYSGYAGAFRCLAEGRGDVAFVKHKTVPDYTDGHGKEAWTRDLLSSDFQLLCDVGGTSPVNNYEHCNLGKVPAHQVVTNGALSPVRRLMLSSLLADSSRYFSDSSKLYRLFGQGNKPDLLFKDSATGLKINPLDSNYEQVLGQRFVDASKAADPKNCV